MDLLAPVVSVGIQAVLVLLDPLVLRVVLAGRGLALKEVKEMVGRQEDKGPKVKEDDEFVKE